MIDSSAMANLQMMMNTGDGRQAVLAELLGHREQAPVSSRCLSHGKTTQHDRLFACYRSIENTGIKTSNGEGLFRVGPDKRSEGHFFRLTDDIISTLDNLTQEEKRPLVTFAEGIAYHYNNILMAMVGYNSIILARLKSSHPAYSKLRESEELIHNTALLLRLVVDVFNRSNYEKSTAYPIDLSTREIIARLCPHPIYPHRSEYLSCGVVDPRIILKIISSIMARRLKCVFQYLQEYHIRTAELMEAQINHKNNLRKIALYIQQGLILAESLLHFTLTVRVGKKRIDLNAMVKEALECVGAYKEKVRYFKRPQVGWYS